MPKTIVENAVCEKCGVDVRENTLYCYNCGSRVVPDPVHEEDAPNTENGAAAEVDAETQAALDDLAEKFKIDEAADKMAKAAAERKKARVTQRKPKEFVWEPKDDASSRMVVLLAILITAIAAAVVAYTVFWR